jgi:hypothetical protein
MEFVFSSFPTAATGFSSYRLSLGQQVRSPLDVLFTGGGESDDEDDNRSDDGNLLFSIIAVR